MKKILCLLCLTLCLLCLGACYRQPASQYRYRYFQDGKPLYFYDDQKFELVDSMLVVKK